MVLVHFLLYDAPTPPPGIFDEFLAIPNLKADIGTRGMASLVNAGNNSDLMRGHRTTFSTVSVRDWTPTLIKAVINETEVGGFKFSPLSFQPDMWFTVLGQESRTQERGLHILQRRTFPLRSSGTQHPPLCLPSQSEPPIIKGDEPNEYLVRVGGPRIRPRLLRRRQG